MAKVQTFKLIGKSSEAEWVKWELCKSFTYHIYMALKTSKQNMYNHFLLIKQ